MRQVTYAPAARLDLRQAVAWETQPGSGNAARARIKALTASIDRLGQHPCRWRSHGPGNRILTKGRYRVIYRVSPDTGRDDTAGDVTTLRVFGPGRMN